MMASGPPTIREFVSSRPFDERDAQEVHLSLVIRGAVREEGAHLREELAQQLLTTKETHWVRMAIEREGRRAELHKAVIEKSFTGLIWAGIVAFGMILLEYAKNHGMWKP